MYCRQCGVQLPTNAEFCSKCGTQTTTNGNDVSNGQDTFFWISLLALILLLYMFAIYHTNFFGTTYMNWALADCSGGEGCERARADGIMIFFGLLFLTVTTISSYKSETDKKNSRKKNSRKKIVLSSSTGTVLDMHNSIRDFTTDYNERKKIYENIESYVKQMVDLGHNEEIARQHAMSYYKQQSKISGKQPTEELIKENQK